MVLLAEPEDEQVTRRLEEAVAIVHTIDPYLFHNQVRRHNKDCPLCQNPNWSLTLEGADEFSLAAPISCYFGQRVQCLFTTPPCSNRYGERRVNAAGWKCASLCL